MIDSPAVAVICGHVDSAGVEGATCVVPCLGGLSAGDLLAAAALGIEQIHLMSGDCRECPEAIAEAALDEAVSAARETVAMLDQTLIMERTRLPGLEPRAAATSPTVSRRGLLRYLARGLERAVTDGVAPRAPERSINALHKQTAPPAARRRLVRDLAEIQSRAGGYAVRLPASLPLADVAVSSDCDACGLCLNYCPHGALAIQDSSVVASSEGCTACGLCVEVCPRSALRMDPATLPPRRTHAQDL